MKLFNLLSAIDYKTEDNLKDIDIENIRNNSNNNCKGSLFVCLKGTNTDGHNYVADAKGNGAVALVVEREVNCDLPQIVVENTHKAMSLLAKRFYNNSVDKIKMIGITGTNGKTSTSYIIKSILEANGKKVGIIGTLGAFYLGKKIECNLTTPDPYDLHRIINEMYIGGVEYIVMEVSAHAIDQFKVWGIKFDVGIFTNCSQDHLDYFLNMENYAKIKKSFFTSDYIKLGVINIDDKLGLEIIEEPSVPFVSYGLSNPSDVFAINCLSKLSGTSFALNMFDNYFEVNSKLVGLYNIYNIMAGATACLLLGNNLEKIKLGIENCTNINGRFNVYKVKNFFVIIDFAHTPDGIKNVLKTTKDACDGRVICIFGCGGNRDDKKRAIMASEAEKYSNFVIVTSDNPRYENPNNIIDDIKQGFKGNNYTCEVDRKKAIEKGIKMCKKNDCLVICGKGGENYQDINGIKVPYSDLEEVKKFIKE